MSLDVEREASTLVGVWSPFLPVPFCPLTLGDESKYDPELRVITLDRNADEAKLTVDLLHEWAHHADLVLNGRAKGRDSHRRLWRDQYRRGALVLAGAGLLGVASVEVMREDAADYAWQDKLKQTNSMETATAYKQAILDTEPWSVSEA